MLGIHVGLQPVLIKEYNSDFELLVVQIKAAEKDIMIMTGYGPQEHWKDQERLPFFYCLGRRNSFGKIPRQTHNSVDGCQ